MRTKLFLAFIFIIILAVSSNVVFERLVIRDFNDFLEGANEDRIYWILASVEGSYNGERWDEARLREALHWGLMLGIETFVEDSQGNQILTSADVLFTMNSRMKSRMESFLKLPAGRGEYTWYPLFLEGKEIGKLYIRPLERIGLIPQKEEIFRRRGKEFLFISFLIAGGGALVLSILFTLFISKPVRKLTSAAEKIAKGDFTVHEELPHRVLKDEIDQLTDTFNFMAEALRREDALRKHLTSNIAHELRTPLTIIKGNLEAIEDGVISDCRKATENIRAEIERLISLVEGIEDMTRAEASFFRRGEPEDINLRDFVLSTAGVMKKLIEEKGLYLRTEGPDLMVRTYPEKLHIILKNLLSNAYKFTETGGISVEWGSHVSDERKGFYVSVADTGIGIEPDKKSRVFDRFYKDHKSAGKGLGLAIVKELSEVMEGTVTLESGKGKGARFTVTF